MQLQAAVVELDPNKYTFNQFPPSQHFHLTVCMLTLLSPQEVDAARSALLSLQPRVTDLLRERFSGRVNAKKKHEGLKIEFGDLVSVAALFA